MNTQNSSQSNPQQNSQSRAVDEESFSYSDYSRVRSHYAASNPAEQPISNVYLPTPARRGAEGCTLLCCSERATSGVLHDSLPPPDMDAHRKRVAAQRNRDAIAREHQRKAAERRQ